MANREAKEVRLVKTHGPDPRAQARYGDETIHHQTWEITDHKGKAHQFDARAGLEGVTTRGGNKKFHINGEEHTARDIIHHAVASSLPASDGERASAKDVVDPDVSGDFAFRG